MSERCCSMLDAALEGTLRDDMAREDHFSLRQVAAILEIDPVRVYRLGRNFGLAPGDPCLPQTVIERAQHAPDTEARYHLVLDWFLTRPPEHSLLSDTVSPI